MAYSQRIDREHPGCVLVLIDHSFSMSEPCAGTDQTKAEAVADATNQLLYELVLRCVKDPSEGPRHYYDVAVIGYGDEVVDALPAGLAGDGLVASSDLGRSPLRIEERPKLVGGDVSTTQTVKRPVWVEPVASGATSMCGAMDRAGRLAAGWVRDHPDSYPPVVINISDGAATDGDPATWAERLRSLSTDDGHTLLFNATVSARAGDPISYPSSDAHLPDTYARTLFAMSSGLPPYMQELAGMAGYELEPDPRGFVFGADIASVASFMQLGTAVKAT